MKVDNCKCSGCKACENICPQNCIRIDDMGRHGFVCVKGEKCNGCGLCEKVCPQNHFNELHKPMEGYNAWTKERKIVKSASSGGIASAIYCYGNKNQINCVGVNFDEKFNLNYVFIDSRKKASNAMGSKYVYSDMGGIYRQIQERIKKREKIIFIGLPCHVAALKNYCKLKGLDNENIVFIDIVCHGVVMPVYFKKHIEYMKRKKRMDSNAKILFRYKPNQFGISIINKGKTVSMISRYDDAYMRIFLKGMYATACFECPFAQINRAGDITIKDSSTPGERRGHQVPANQSSVLINTDVGQKFWKKLENVIEHDAYPIRLIRDEDVMLQRPTPKKMSYKMFCFLESFFGYRIAGRFMWGITDAFKQMIAKE